MRVGKGEGMWVGKGGGEVLRVGKVLRMGREGRIKGGKRGKGGKRESVEDGMD